MKPFDLEKALAGEKVVTREGGEVIFITSRNSVIYPIFVVHKTKDGYVNGTAHTSDGNYIHNNTEHSNFDLFMAPKTKKIFVALHTDDGGMVVAQSFATSEEAKNNLIMSFTHTKIIEWEIEE